MKLAFILDTKLAVGTRKWRHISIQNARIATLLIWRRRLRRWNKKNEGDIGELINFAFLVRDLGKEEVREMAKEWIDKKLFLSKLYYHLTACNDI